MLFDGSPRVFEKISFPWFKIWNLSWYFYSQNVDAFCKGLANIDNSQESAPLCPGGKSCEREQLHRKRLKSLKPTANYYM